MNDNTNLGNVFQNINSNKFPFILLIIFIIITLIVIISSDYSSFSKHNKEQSSTKNEPIWNNKASINSIIICSFILIILILSLLFLPSFKEIKNLFSQISNVTYVILYTIFLILFYRLMPHDTLNKNAYYIVPITIAFAFIIFFISFQSNYVGKLDMNYERIKIMIMYFCFITICITFYSINPGNYITKNFNISLLIASLIGIFGFIYLILLLTLPGIYDNFTFSKDTTNILENVSPFSKYGGISFLLFLITMTIILATYPGGFLKTSGAASSNNSVLVLSLLLIVCIIWSILLVSNMFTGVSKNIPNTIADSYLSFIKKTLLALFGFTISGLIIAFIVYSVNHFSGKTNISSFILSIFLILSILILMYKTIFVRLPSNKDNKAKAGFFQFILNLLFYIPCLFSGVLDTIMKTLVNEYNSNTTGNYIILFVTIILMILYFYFPSIQHYFNLQGGKQLIDQPVYTNTLQSLANYEQLNGSNNFDYQYAISFWIYLDSFGPNTNGSYNTYTSLLNFGGKPNVLYKADTNTLMITMNQKDLSKKGTNKLIELDDNGNRIIYTNKNMLLQKWNNVIINYNGGTLDVFLNGELVKSSIEVVPYMNMDMLTIGSDSGVIASICNVVYYKKPLTMTNIYYIYNNNKNKTKIENF